MGQSAADAAVGVAEEESLKPPVEWKQQGGGRRAVALNGMMDTCTIFLDLLSMDCCNCLAILHRQPAADLLVSQQEIRLC